LDNVSKSILCLGALSTEIATAVVAWNIATIIRHVTKSKLPLQDNGYQLLFLSARAISQAYLTRQFLVNVKQVALQICFKFKAKFIFSCLCRPLFITQDIPILIMTFWVLDGVFFTPILWRGTIALAFPHNFPVYYLKP